MTPISVLIVDDSAVVRQVLVAMFKEAPGIEVIAAVADPLLAIERMKLRWPDVIVLDVEMPKMDGITFLRRLRAMPGGKRPKVLFCTIETRPERIAEALAAGADDYVMKPFDGEILQSKLTEVGAIAA